MKARLQPSNRPSHVVWLFATIASVLCCTHLESGADTFSVTSSAGTGNGASAGTAGTGAQATGGSGASGGRNAGGNGGTNRVDGGANDGGAGDNGCIDERGFDGLGCFRCAPLDIVSLENACTTASCQPFDNSLRVPSVKAGKLPDLPAPAAGGSAGAGGSGGTAGTGGGVGVGFACSSLAEGGTVLYVTGSTAAKPFLQQIAQQLALQKVFVVYTSVGSCTGVDAIVHGTLMRTGAAPLAASATYWDSSSSTGKACDLAEAGVNADLGISDVFAPSCPGFELANLEALKIRDAHGPIQTMTFAVPANAKHHQISQQAAYMVFGFGKDGQVLDASGQQIWNDESALLQRSASSGTQVMLAAAIGVAPGLWKGTPNKSSDDVANALQAGTATQAAADATLGILGADYIDSRNLRAQIRMLAFQDSHQACAVTPDSSDNAKDKRNVRDGHYPIWGPMHLLYKVNDKGDPQNEAVRQELIDVVGYLSGAKALPNGVNLIDVYAQSGLVPECAMRVTRSADGGAITPATPLNPCACLFEQKATGATDCTACKVQGDCAAGETCSQGYCEQP